MPQRSTTLFLAIFILGGLLGAVISGAYYNNIILQKDDVIEKLGTRLSDLTYKLNSNTESA